MAILENNTQITRTRVFWMQLYTSKWYTYPSLSDIILVCRGLIHNVDSPCDTATRYAIRLQVVHGTSMLTCLAIPCRHHWHTDCAFKSRKPPYRLCNSISKTSAPTHRLVDIRLCTVVISAYNDKVSLHCFSFMINIHRIIPQRRVLYWRCKLYHRQMRGLGS